MPLPCLTVTITVNIICGGHLQAKCDRQRPQRASTCAAHQKSPTRRIRLGHPSPKGFRGNWLDARFWIKANPSHAFGTSNLVACPRDVTQGISPFAVQPLLCHRTVFHRRTSYWTPHAGISFHRMVLGGSVTSLPIRIGSATGDTL